VSLSPFEVGSAGLVADEEQSLDALDAGRTIEGRSPLRLALARLRSDRIAWLAAGMIILMVLLALCAPLISAVTGHSPYNPDLVNGTNSFGQPYGPGQAGFVLGTDNVGRDILVRVAYGARISLLVGILATLLATVGGTILGLVSGYYGGWIDAVLARMMDAVLSFPYVLAAIVLAAVFGGSLPLTIGVIAFFSWAAIGRIVRGQTLSQKEKEYVEAARSIGAGSFRIMFVDILPNLIAPVIVLGTLLVPVAIVFEATLDYLGVGVGPPTPTWGNMLADDQGSAGFGAWWFWVFPSVALLITTLGFNLLGDSVRDALDPRTERLFANRRKKVVVGAEPNPLSRADSKRLGGGTEAP
jgi:peptide/nickel transport system permease protein